MQAPTDDPDFYLSHDVYGNYNIYGAIHLDAECAEAGLDSRNAVILGHHSGNLEAAPFGVIQNTGTKPSPPGTPQSFFRLRSGNGPTRCGSRRSSTVWEPSKRTVFHNDEDFRMWYDAMRVDAAMTLDGTTEPEQAVSLVSCSYYVHPENERTVVVASGSGWRPNGTLIEVSAMDRKETNMTEPNPWQAPRTACARTGAAAGRRKSNP